MEDQQSNAHNVAFGSVIRELRVAAGQTQEFLAFETEMDRTYIGRVEMGRVSPTLDTIMKLCTSLDVTLLDIASLMSQKLSK